MHNKRCCQRVSDAVSHVAAETLGTTRMLLMTKAIELGYALLLMTISQQQDPRQIGELDPSGIRPPDQPARNARGRLLRKVCAKHTRSATIEGCGQYRHRRNLDAKLCDRVKTSRKNNPSDYSCARSRRLIQAMRRKDEPGRTHSGGRLSNFARVERKENVT